MNHCSKCGAELEPSAEPAPCPACLLEAGLNAAADPAPLGADDVPAPGARNTAVQRPDQEPTRKFGPYDLLAEMARGCQGVVYPGKHRSLKRLVGLKMLILGPWATEAHLKRLQ